MNNYGIPTPIRASYVVEAQGANSADDLIALYQSMEPNAADMLNEFGSILFRGFEIRDQQCFARIVRSIGGEIADYVDGNSPRTKIASGVYTSTEYPPAYSISLHNELSYAGRWPSRLFFFCLVAPRDGGATTLADSRSVLHAIDPAIVDEFRRKQVKYVRNLHSGIGYGKSWQQTFETDDPSVVEGFLAASGSQWEWKADKALRIWSVYPATAWHPKTREEVWFNQADQFHPSTHPKDIYETLKTLYEGNEDDLPQNAYFGDGTPIPESMLESIRNAVASQTVDCQWQLGDFLIVDNVLMSHGRRSFRGERKILVSMTGELSWESCGRPLDEPKALRLGAK
jgi:alpha-ketoglutarate-dependent taurine dioxygenase